MSEPRRLDEVITELRQRLEQDRPPSTNPTTPGVCFWCKKNCGGTCLGLPTQEEGSLGPVQMRPDDPAYSLLTDGHTTSTTVHDDSCYICRDPEFAQMGLPLCKPCPECSAKEGTDAGHVPADDEVCSVCGFNLRVYYEVGQDMDAYRKIAEAG